MYDLGRSRINIPGRGKVGDELAIEPARKSWLGAIYNLHSLKPPTFSLYDIGKLEIPTKLPDRKLHVQCIIRV